jgi:hypothetical protein
MYSYSKIKTNIYAIAIESSSVQCVLCFRSEPSWRIDRVDFGSLPIDTPPQDVHPELVDYESRIEGIAYKEIYDTIAQICFERVQVSNKILYMRADLPQKLRMLRWFVNKHLDRFIEIADVYAVVDNQQVLYSRSLKADPSVYLVVPKLKT